MIEFYNLPDVFWVEYTSDGIQIDSVESEISAVLSGPIELAPQSVTLMSYEFMKQYDVQLILKPVKGAVPKVHVEVSKTAELLHELREDLREVFEE